MIELYQSLDKIVLLGGTFDPVHNGHMQMARRLKEIFNTRVTFVPTGIPPYKAAPKASNQQRLEMLELAIDNNPAYQIDNREISADHYYYTHKSLVELRSMVGNEVPVYFLIGSDSLLTFHSWHYWTELLGLANFVIAGRNGYDISQIASAELLEHFNQHKTADLTDQQHSNGKFYLLNYTPQNVSSTYVRAQIKQHQGISTLVPDAVAEYIRQQQLYLD